MPSLSPHGLLAYHRQVILEMLRPEDRPLRWQVRWDARPPKLWECNDDVVQSLAYGSTFVDFMARQVEKHSLCGEQCCEKRGVCFACLKPPAVAPSCLDRGPPRRGPAPSCALLLHLTLLANGAPSAEAEKMKVCARTACLCELCQELC